MSTDLSNSLSLVTPEFILAIGGLVLLMVGVYAGDRSGRLVTGLAVVVLVLAGLWIMISPTDGIAFGARSLPMLSAAS